MMKLTALEIKKRIVKLQSLVMHARNGEAHKFFLPLDEFSEEVSIICDSSLYLAQEDARLIKPMLIKLRENLTALTLDITNK